MPRFAAAALLLLTAACATAPDAPSGPPDYAPLVGSPAPANARHYVDCIAQSVQRGTWDRLSEADGEGRLLRFTCDGAPARAFFEALAARSAAIGSEWSHDGRTWRATERVERDLYGVDYCSAAAGTDHRCAIALNTGAFLGE